VPDIRELTGASGNSPASQDVLGRSFTLGGAAGLSEQRPPAGATVSTGIAGLDEVLNGGLLEGHFYLLEGEPGIGKTTLNIQFLLEGARRQEQVLYIALSE
jgi:predicted ATP-dependent serine protease